MAHAEDEAAKGAAVGAEAPQGPVVPRVKQRRGFAAMDPARRREIASRGGQASHARGTGHEWSSSAAREAGRKGGLVSRGGRGKVDPKAPTEEVE